MNAGANAGRTALVIGAASGMGAACARALKVAGYDLVVADLSLDALRAVADSLAARAVATDVADSASIANLAKHCANGVDALVHTAGLSMSMASFERIIEVNLGGTARVLDAFQSLMHPGGAAVCFASIAGHMVGEVSEATRAALDKPLEPHLAENVRLTLPREARIPGMAYGLSKLGVLRLVQRTGVAWGPNGVRVCSVSPGLIETPMGNLERSAEADAAVAVAPIPRVGRPDEVADLVTFLCSEKAGFLTAIDIIIDGGWVSAIQTATAESPIAKVLAASRAKN
ncbi:MAG: SDR family oxidoreductase [Hyphomonadaceae bacterium]|nr:SDR family oxidoreductase [Hyphomonadaceae bacterium]